MGEDQKQRTRLGRWGFPAAILVAAALSLAACASSSGSRGVDADAPDPAGAAAATAPLSTPRQIESVELREGAPSTYLDILADGPLVWTSYRDDAGNLVIELPNSVPSAGVASLDQGEGLVTAVRVQQEAVAERPLTRLTVITRHEAEHSLDAEGERLRLALMPIEQERRTSYEPLPVEEAQLTEVETDPGSAPSTPPAPTARPTPTTTSPSPDAPGATPATVLAGVSIVSRGDGATVKVTGDGSFRYTTFQLTNPDRFVLDLEGVVNASPQSTLVVAGGGVERVRVAQFKPFPDPVSRVVFDLTEPGEPVLEAGSDGLTVRFGGAVAETPPEPTPLPMPSEPLQQDQVAEVVEGPTEDVAPDEFEETLEPVAREGTQTAVEDEQIAERVEPPMPAPEPAQEGPPTTVAETVPPPWEEEAEAAEPAPPEESVAELQPTPAPEPPPWTEVEDAPLSDVAMFEAAEVQYDTPTEQQEGLTTAIDAEVVGVGGQIWSGDPISLSLRDADIKDVLRSFSTITGLNVVVHPGVRGTVTVELNDVPWDQALDLILRINNLDYVLEGNIMRIASSSQLQAEAEQRRRLAAAQAQEIPLSTVIRAISYAEATEIASLLTTSQGAGGSSSRILSPRGSVAVDRRTNKLIIKELPSNMNAVLAVIANLDTAEPQVLIEARIVETTKQFSRTLGIEWSFDGISSAATGNTTGLTFPHQGTANGGVQLLTGGQNGFLDITMGNILNTFQLDLSLQAAETEGLVSILSAPKIATLNNERASIQSGLQIPIQTVSNNTVSVQFVNATLQLEVTPQVTAEGTVLMDINIAKRAPQPALAVAGSTNAPISTKQARTRVIVRDGGTTVIGGIYEVTSDRGVDRVPGLANVPILGHLFRNKRRNNNNEELLIFLTPRVIQL